MYVYVYKYIFLNICAAYGMLHVYVLKDGNLAL